MDILKLIIKRLVYLLILMIGLATIVFVLTRLVPGDPVSANLSQRNLNNPEIVEAFRVKWGLDKPVWEQYLLYMKQLFQLDFGTSMRTGKAVIDELIRCFPATFELAFFATLFAAIFGILFGVISALKRNSIIDQLVRSISIVGVSIPTFWFALLLLYVFYFTLGISPGTGRLSSEFLAPNHVTGLYVLDSILEGNLAKAWNSFQHILLPAICLGSFSMGLIARTTRSNMLDIMSTDYIRTAKAKGLSTKAVVWKHAFGNVLIPVLTVIGLGFGNLLGGTVLVEQIFSIPGVGQFAYQSVTTLDSPGIIGCAMLIAFNYTMINIIVDVIHGIVDPKVRT